MQKGSEMKLLIVLTILAWGGVPAAIGETVKPPSDAADYIHLHVTRHGAASRAVSCRGTDPVLVRL